MELTEGRGRNELFHPVLGEDRLPDQIGHGLILAEVCLVVIT
jgi:hypothetical protein